jgi:outer membrane protein OmpA-like peptidoglycan-associated protein
MGTSLDRIEKKADSSKAPGSTLNAKSKVAVPKTEVLEQPQLSLIYIILCDIVLMKGWKVRLSRLSSMTKHSIFFVFIFSVTCLSAQTAGELDLLLETREVSFAQASRFVLAVADAVDEKTETGAAYALAVERKWLPRRAEGTPDAPIKLGELCFLIMKAFDMKGSFLYALFPGPRYAFRELDYLKLIPVRRDPAITVSGEGFLQILGMAAAYTGANRTAAETPEIPKIIETEESPPVVETAAPASEAEAAAERELLADVIRGELEQYEITETTVRVVEEGVAISLDNIQFTPDSVELVEAEKAKLRGIAAILSAYPERKILVSGHTAMAGTDEGRMQISTERARAVADFLVSLQVRGAEDIAVRGYGAERPLGDNATAEGQAINRRVEITLMDE